MTSRFGKTYSRKGGNGNSKFDEVFSNKRTTLSIKWGVTTFMAKLGQKGPNFKPNSQEILKKPKLEEENTGDPFGFDSDDESLPVSSKNLAQDKVENFHEEHEKNSHHIHKNADDSTEKPNAETTVASEIKET
ncbi:Wings apart-like protein-like protein [Plecturocebus cupreus]